MNDQNKSPLQREFEQSETYRVISKVGGRMARELNRAGVTADKVSETVHQVEQSVNRVVDTVNREFSGQNRPNKNRYSSTAYPNTSRSSQPVRPVPPPQRPVQQRPQPARPVPPPQKPQMVMRRKPSNAKYWITGIACAMYAMSMPMYEWFHLIPLALIGVGAYVVGRALFRGKKYFVPGEPPAPAPVQKPEPKPERTERKVNTGNPEVDKIIAEGYDYIKQLRAANDRIEDAPMSQRMDRMEAACEDIFAYITKHPESAPQIRRFMNYYLPTTLKLLNSYDNLSRQRVKGENVRSTMFEIEGMMETIAGAFEKQHDSLFEEAAMDIAADISVMESLLEQEGLSGDGELPKVQTSGGAAETSGAVPTIRLDPNEAE